MANGLTREQIAKLSEEEREALEAQAIHATSGEREYEIRTGEKMRAVFVYQWPIRVWHWINALAIIVLCVTGYLIASPLPTVSGEATNNFWMGYIRFIHFSAGYIMAIGFVARIIVAIFGNSHAREMFTVPLFSKAFWEEFGFMLKSYAFMTRDTHRYVGHNPLARVSMVGFSLLAAFMIASGLALYGEGTLVGSWANTFFSSWMIPLFGNNSYTLHTWHHFGMWAMVVFIMIHIYAVIREETVGSQSMTSTMVSGYRYFKDND